MKVQFRTAFALAIVTAWPSRAGHRIRYLPINWLDSLCNGCTACCTGAVGARLASGRSRESRGGVMDPSPDYDASDEIEFFFNYLTWGLRGVSDGNGYPPPAYPPV
ncbi:conserved hypothetical protein [Mycobacterium ulcerans Agy99]|uniref:Uncharacterized protein n=3 Tax=Mycobacterium ulcerans TaxID=1809 RepID=A0PWD9_MYCUA|nr:conserved hypothetical protein [Mycobacterium ulcerans Agy99]